MLYQLDFWYWFDYLAYICSDYQVIPKSIFIYHPDTIFCKKKHIPRGIKLKRYAKFYYNDMICRSENKGGYDVKRHFQRYFRYIVASVLLVEEIRVPYDHDYDGHCTKRICSILTRTMNKIKQSVVYQWHHFQYSDSYVDARWLIIYKCFSIFKETHHQYLSVHLWIGILLPQP